jgi:putative hemolysin
VIEAQEHQMVRNVFRLDDRQIGSMMIPRAEIVWLDVNAPRRGAGDDDRAGPLALPGVPRRTWTTCSACSAHAQAAAAAGARRSPRWPTTCSRRSSCPRRCRAWNCSNTSRQSGTELVFVVDEYGAVQGVITERDVLEAITGEFGSPADEKMPGPCSASRAAG